MSSVVEICNLALDHLGLARISSIDEASAPAQRCKLQYDYARDFVLSKHHWGFARGLQVLAENVTNDRSTKWAFSYAQPSDLLTIRYIVPSIEGAASNSFLYGVMQEGQELWVPFDAEAGNIYCDVSPATLIYTKRIEDATKFPSLVTDAIAAYLAFRIAMPLTRDRSLRSDAQTIFMQTMAAATTWDANQIKNTSDAQSDFVAQRS